MANKKEIVQQKQETNNLNTSHTIQQHYDDSRWQQMCLIGNSPVTWVLGKGLRVYLTLLWHNQKCQLTLRDPIREIPPNSTPPPSWNRSRDPLSISPSFALFDVISYLSPKPCPGVTNISRNSWKLCLSARTVESSFERLSFPNMWTVVLYCPGGTQDSVQTEQTSDCRTPRGNLTVA